MNLTVKPFKWQQEQDGSATAYFMGIVFRAFKNGNARYSASMVIGSQRPEFNNSCDSLDEAKSYCEKELLSMALSNDFKPVSEPLSDIFDDILQWHEDACENPNYADEVVGRACMAEEFGEWCKSLTYFYEADILRKSAQDLYKSAEHIRATNYGERHFINRKAHLDSLVDLIWVAMQDGYRSGYDMKGALKELIRSNNSKRLPDGTFPRNEAGKIIKTSPTFTDVDLTEFI